ncbi:FGGY-family carbohydrate kinase [Nitratireductor kimnyeongensis]|uniref:FGGY-family carbohydrate kinase n=1 Tax=Nitratireductor kimnyeongensis TaxID=430679 RepID=A0ABW0TCI2_9HYPH|nr:FGGY family carbohydrate kinase [Nitratireductor kimnyeongensis]QZZ37515.1 xylulose kinase [Nitratireductor kimnyeongensis]
MSRTVLAIDIGSSALKAVLFSEHGAMLAARSASLVIASGTDRSQTQDPADWWAALVSALADIPDRKDVEALVFTGSMQNLIVLSPEGEALAPAALYSDRRLNEAEIAELQARLPDDYAERVGNHPDPAHTIFKLMRLDRFAPDLLDEHRFFFGAKDAVTFRLTGRAVIDPTVASTTGLMNIAARCWDAELLATAGVAATRLPEILPADEILGPLRAEAAAELGLSEGIPVFNGAGDAAAATWGAAADAPGRAYAYLGTTGWVAATLTMQDAAAPRDIYTLADPVHRDRVIIISPFLTAGAAMDWLAETTGESVDALLEAAETADDARALPLFLPYLSGERAPFEDQRVRGAFLGLDRTHGKGAMARAVLEGVAFAIRHNLETAGLPPSPLTIIGGAARTPLQRQILADVLNLEVAFPDASQEMTARGALRMIAAKAGLSLAAMDASPARAPDTTHAARCDSRYQAYLAASRFAREQANSII